MGHRPPCCCRYTERAWEFGGLRVRASCSDAASTDFDLTGQVPWPALTVLGHFLGSGRGRVLCRGAHVCELGAGVGVPGLLAAAQGAASLLLTDHNDFVVQLLRENLALNGACPPITCCLCTWPLCLRVTCV